MEVKPGYRDKEKVSHFYEQRCPFNRGKRYKDCVSIFRDQILCPLNGGVPCIQES